MGKILRKRVRVGINSVVGGWGGRTSRSARILPTRAIARGGGCTQGKWEMGKQGPDWGKGWGKKSR